MEKINGLEELVHSIQSTADKHTKGYIYDSLMYRYIRARENMAEYEWIRDGKKYDKEHYYRSAKQDMLRFSQILNEVIGEHD